MKKLILFIVLFTPVYMVSCVPKQPSSNFPKITKTDVSATDVVKTFLDSLIEGEFGTAYDQIYVVSSDKEGYVSRMNLLREERNVRLVSYKVLGTQLFKDTAIVVAELETERGVDGGIEKKFTRNKYDLQIIEKEWKITKDTCIENCT